MPYQFQSNKAIAESPLGGQATVASLMSPDAESAATPPKDQWKSNKCWCFQHTIDKINDSLISVFWVQSQLRDHPDELWKDGVRDYLAQASDILEKFTNVLNWLKANSGSEVKSVQANEKEIKSVPGTIIFGGSGANAGLIPSSNSGVSSTQASVLSSTASSDPSWSFGLSASTRVRLQRLHGALGYPLILNPHHQSKLSAFLLHLILEYHPTTKQLHLRALLALRVLQVLDYSRTVRRWVLGKLELPPTIKQLLCLIMNPSSLAAHL